MRFEIPLLVAFATSAMARMWAIPNYKEKDCKGQISSVSNEDGKGYDKCYDIKDSSSIGVDVERADIVVRYYSSAGCENFRGDAIVTDRKRCYNADGYKIGSFKLIEG